MKPYAITILTAFLAFNTASGQSKQVQINTKVVSIPLDAALLRDAGLTLDAAPGLSNLGVISTEKVAAMIAKLEKAPGVVLLAAPSLVTKSGTRATAESTRELIYPTKFDPPKLSSTSDAKPVQPAPGQIVAATPTSPTQFEMRQFGVRIECEPTISADGSIIELTLAPELVTFEGFVNYGSPIKAVATDKDGKMLEGTLTENQIMQPVFQVVKTTTGVSIPNGHCLILGGQGGSANPLNATGQKPNLSQVAHPEQKSANVVFFFIQAKVITP